MRTESSPSFLMIFQADWKDQEYPSTLTGRIGDKNSAPFLLGHATSLSKLILTNGLGREQGHHRGSPSKTQNANPKKSERTFTETHWWDWSWVEFLKRRLTDKPKIEQEQQGAAHEDLRESTEGMSYEARQGGVSRWQHHNSHVHRWEQHSAWPHRY